MTLTTEDVIKIAKLARLGIDEQDLPVYGNDLRDILELMQQMGQTDTGDVLPMAHPMEQVQRFRDDVVTEINNRENFQAIAPLVEDGLYLVPKVIE